MSFLTGNQSGLKKHFCLKWSADSDLLLTVDQAEKQKNKLT